MEFEQGCRFRSDFYHDLKLQKEVNRGMIEGNLYYRIMYLIITGVLIWFFVEMALVLDAVDAYAETLPGIAAIWLIIEGIRFLAGLGGGIHYKRSLMLNGGTPTHDSVLFCDDCIYTLEQESGNKTKLNYDTVRIVYETENLLLLGMKYGTFLIVDKRSLTGTKEELGQFLYEKCPKLRGKKVRNCRTGRVINYIKWGTILLSLLIAFVFHPKLQINRRLQGQIHNGMSVTEIAAELEAFGITGMEPEQLEGMNDSFFYLSDSKLEHLLYVLGAGDIDFDSGSWTPAETGVFFTYYWSDAPETMYEDFLRGISAMSRGEITIEHIEEDWSSVDRANYDGFITVDFTLNGEEKQLEAVFYEEWYDEQIFNTLSAMVQESTGKQLYFADFENTGCFIFLGDDAWAQRFADRTGLELSSDINEIYY